MTTNLLLFVAFYL